MSNRIITIEREYASGGRESGEMIAERLGIPCYNREILQMASERCNVSMDYLETAEGKQLPVKHCIRGSHGWEIRKEVSLAMPKAVIIDKPTFGSMELVRLLQEKAAKEELEIELVGLCTDICVVTNALLLKTVLPETVIRVDGNCCAGVTPKSHEAALLTMQMCQVLVSGS